MEASEFGSVGEVGFLAQLASAAYYDIAPSIGVDLGFRWLQASDLNSLNTSITSFREGLYTNLNAAVRIGRTQDSLFIAFRGTDDPIDWVNNVVGNLGAGSDLSDFVFNHFSYVKAAVDAALQYAAAQNEIKTVYLTGHSLGASMVQAALKYTDQENIRAALFAPPGFLLEADSSDARALSFLVDGDPIKLALAVLGNLPVDLKIFSYSTANALPISLGLHDIDLYAAFAKELSSLGFDWDDLRQGGAASFVEVHAAASSSSASTFVLGAGPDSLSARSGSAVLLGGPGSDTLRGSSSNDLLIGGTEADRLSGAQEPIHFVAMQAQIFLPGGQELIPSLAVRATT